jgi:hypothetical protein
MGMAIDELAKLASAIERQTATDVCERHRGVALCLCPLSCTSLPSVTSPEGAKESLLAEETYRLYPAQPIRVSVDLPVAARILLRGSHRARPGSGRLSKTVAQKAAYSASRADRASPALTR